MCYENSALIGITAIIACLIYKKQLCLLSWQCFYTRNLLELRPHKSNSYQIWHVTANITKLSLCTQCPLKYCIPTQPLLKLELLNLLYAFSYKIHLGYIGCSNDCALLFQLKLLSFDFMMTHTDAVSYWNCRFMQIARSQSKMETQKPEKEISYLNEISQTLTAHRSNID